MGKMLRYSKIPVLAFFATLVVGLLVFYGVQEADVAEAQSSTPTPAASPSPEPSPTVAVSDSSCIDCHTDQETLMATAEEEVETENLSEGEG